MSSSECSLVHLSMCGKFAFCFQAFLDLLFIDNWLSHLLLEECLCMEAIHGTIRYNEWQLSLYQVVSEWCPEFLPFGVGTGHCSSFSSRPRRSFSCGRPAFGASAVTQPCSHSSHLLETQCQHRSQVVLWLLKRPGTTRPKNDTGANWMKNRRYDSFIVGEWLLKIVNYKQDADPEMVVQMLIQMLISE